MNLIKKWRRLEKMSYTDKEMQVSTQIAYMNITQDQINEYLKDHNGEYPTIQEILTDSKYGQDICNALMERRTI